MQLIEATSIHRLVASHNLSLAVSGGENHSLVGSDNTGKSTTICALFAFTISCNAYRSIDVL